MFSPQSPTRGEDNRYIGMRKQIKPLEILEEVSNASTASGYGRCSLYVEGKIMYKLVYNALLDLGIDFNDLTFGEDDELSQFTFDLKALNYKAKTDREKSFVKKLRKEDKIRSRQNDRIKELVLTKL